MHVLYIDDSGSVSDSTQQFLVLGGISVFERGLHHVIRQADECVASFSLGDPHEIELHATDMYGGRGQPWASMRRRTDREALLQCALGTLVRYQAAIRLFAVAVDKAAVSPRDPVELAFEELCNRFNLFLQRQRNRGDDQRGLIVMDESKHEKPLQTLARNFRVNGGRYGQYRHVAEVPLFVDSKATRLIQLADLVAWSTFRKYEFSDGRFFDQLIPRFDQDGGVIHGLYHMRGPGPHDPCYCPACMSRTQARCMEAPAPASSAAPSPEPAPSSAATAAREQ